MNEWIKTQFIPLLNIQGERTKNLDKKKSEGCSKRIRQPKIIRKLSAPQ